MGHPAQQIVEPELLRQLLRYDPATGELFWLPRSAENIASGRNGAAVEARRFNSKFAGKPALNHLDARGYRVGALFNRFLSAHRAGWALHTGAWPAGEIDHINGLRADNRLCNLRDVPIGENNKNIARSKANTSGVTGVHWRPDHKKWGCNIRYMGKLKHLGFFDDFAAAVVRRKDAEREYGYHPNHGRAA